MKHIKLKLSLLVVGLLVVVAGPSAGVQALADTAPPDQDITTQREQHQEMLKEQAQEHSGAPRMRLEKTKLKVCQLREKNIDNVMMRMSDRGQKQLDLFTQIAERTEHFYTQKGKVLSNYDTLVSAVGTQKAAAQTAVDALKASEAGFKCDGDDPKGAAQVFKDKLKAQNEALKAYKTAVKNLIVGVKSVQGTANHTGGEQ